VGDLHRRSLRFAVGLALLLVGLVEVHTLLQGLRSQRRLRDRVVHDAREQVMAALPQVRAVLGTGGEENWDAAARRALESAAASEVEVVDGAGSVLFSRPTVLPVAYVLSPAEVETARRDGVLALAAQSGPSVRALTYVAFDDGPRPLFLRLATAVPDLESDVRERQQSLFVHLAALSVLVFAAGLTLLPDRPGREASPGPRVLQAYEQAMERLRDRGEEMSREHSAERRRMADELAERAVMARAGELTAGIVHEVRNGLGTVLGYARLLEHDASSAAQDAGRSIRQECETLEVVIRRFTDYVKQDTLNLASVDLARLLARVVAREARGESAATALVVDADEPAIVADEELLERAFENLVRNAREAAGPRGRVSIRVWRVDERVGVSVEDDGPGFPEEVGEHPRPFFTTKPGGLGLGLPLVHKIVRLHEGVLVLRGREPRGASAEVWLPGGGPRNAADSPRSAGVGGERPATLRNIRGPVGRDVRER
jgi:signal transduction histidine kinase